ncbi:hypothetical protein CP532_1501 [Ophiocordyceps camponoti-leonardi (nom. inval.)]|nr:hypothetical protein CP532_1501 [Ophiocordyceps camponoti-leonardi (nom. inval.)]
MAQLSKRKAGQEPATEQTSDAATSKRQKLPVRAKAVEKGTLVTFDDEGNAEQTAASFSAQARSVAEEVKEDSEDDEDAAPEALSTARVATELKQSEQAAQRSARKKAAEEKQKRQERDTLLKKQAGERKRTANDALATASANDVPAEDDDNGESSADKVPTATGGRRRKKKTTIPDHLPAELLEDSSSEDEEQEPQRRRHAKNVPTQSRRKENVAEVESRLTRLDKAPRDQVVRSTVFRVAATVDARLAPKARKDSLQIRERLLRRKRTVVVGRSGFFSSR